jgi:hypothetical protein
MLAYSQKPYSIQSIHYPENLKRRCDDRSLFGGLHLALTDGETFFVTARNSACQRQADKRRGQAATVAFIDQLQTL